MKNLQLQLNNSKSHKYLLNPKMVNCENIQQEQLLLVPCHYPAVWLIAIAYECL